MILDSILTYIGLSMGATEKNPIMAGTAGTWGGIILMVCFAYIFLRMIILDIAVGNMEKKSFKITYTILLSIEVLVVLNNAVWIIIHL